MKKLLIIALITGSLATIKSVNDYTFTMQAHPKEKACIVEALWHEARGESINGITAVLTVIKNRVYSDLYPNTYCKVIYQDRQFSYTHQVRYKKPIVKPSERAIMQTIEALADAILKGQLDGVIPDDVLWYHTVKVKPSWNKRMQTHIVIGKHRFLKAK